MIVLAWRDPPEIRPDRVRLLAQELQNNPGRWALIESGLPPVYLPWWHRLGANLEYEWKVVRHGDGRVSENGASMSAFPPLDVYMRYVGEDGS